MNSRHIDSPCELVPERALTPAEIVDAVALGALGKARYAPNKTLGLAVSAGVAIAIGFAFYVTVTTGGEGAPWGLTRLVGGSVFSLGLILILVCGGDLFTSSILTCVPWAGQRLSTAQLLRNWSIVYVGNLIGALSLAGLVLAAGLHQQAAGRWGVNVLNIASHKLHHDFAAAFALGVLCNLMVCVAVWMSYSTRRVGEKMLLVMLPVALFVSSGFEHVVANMFIVPLAMGVVHTADASFWQMIGQTANAYSELSVANFVTHNLVPVTLGNIVGGLIVGLGHWALHGNRRFALPAATQRAPLESPEIIAVERRA